MSEPEELILEGAHFATRVARDAWRRYGPPTADRGVALGDVRARLEIFVTALFNRPIDIAPMDLPAPRSWLGRLAHGRDRGTTDTRFLSGTDGRRLYLPPVLGLDGNVDGSHARSLLRLMAVEQGRRLTRGTVRIAMRIQDPVVREWFMLAEAAAADRWIAAELPGLRPTLEHARADALAERRRASRSDDALERGIRALLSAAPNDGAPDLPTNGDTERSRAWAEDMAATHAADARRRAPEPVWYWGRLIETDSSVASASRAHDDPDQPHPAGRARVVDLRRRPRARKAADDEDDERSGTWVVRADDPQESVEDPLGLQRPADRDQHADPEGLADSLSELPEARMVRTPERPREVLRSDQEVQRRAHSPAALPRGRGIAYPEWNCQTGHYRRPGAIVRQPPAPLGDAAWAASALARRARLVRRVRTRFERLRPRPITIDRQLDGTDVDLGAYVTAAGDLRAGTTIDGRLYVAQRPARRELVVSLLVDTSASTDAWVSSDRRIVDVEKEALLVVGEALDALGDPYGVFAFSGEGPDDVVVHALKDFGEPGGALVHRRIAALDSDRYTRLGAPIRHLTAALCRERPARRLLLVLSDGKPNDVDAYEGRYGIEDTRQAVAEARRQGVSVFCLTVDRDAPRYAARIFGARSFAVLHRAEQLPTVLIDVLRQLIRA